MSNRLNHTVTGPDTYSYSEVVEEFCTFFGAGTDTSSYHMTMLIVYVSRHPQIKEKMQQ